MLYSGKLVKRIRKQYGLSLEKISFGLCSYSQLAKIERGEKSPEKLLQDI